MRLLLLRIFCWIIWKDFNRGLNLVLGHRSLAQSISEQNKLERFIRGDNMIPSGALTWDNTPKTDRQTFARYETLKQLNAVGELLALFRSVELPKMVKNIKGDSDD